MALDLNGPNTEYGNPYYTPEKYGCEIVATVDVAGDYEFDMFVVLRTIEPIEGIRKGTYFYASDSGCSCPSPFEGAYWTKATKAELIRAFDSWVSSRYSTYRTEADITSMKMDLRNL